MASNAIRLVYTASCTSSTGYVPASSLWPTMAISLLFYMLRASVRPLDMSTQLLNICIISWSFSIVHMCLRASNCAHGFSLQPGSSNSDDMVMSVSDLLGVPWAFRETASCNFWSSSVAVDWQTCSVSNSFLTHSCLVNVTFPNFLHSQTPQCLLRCAGAMSWVVHCINGPVILCNASFVCG